jgi:hypothetical protein
MTTTGHRPPLHLTEQHGADVAAILGSALRSGIESPTPGPLLATAATLLTIAEAGSDPTSTTTLIRALAAWDRPASSAGALAIASLIGDEGLRREVRRDAADRGHPLPRWLVQLHRSEPAGRAVELSTVFRDVDEIVVGVTVPGGHPLTAVVEVDNELGARAVGGRLLGESVDAVVQRVPEGDQPDTRVRDIASADARARLAHALRGPDLEALHLRVTPWRQARPLVAWMLTLLPDGGDATVPGTRDDVDLDDVAEGFLASPWGRPWTRCGLTDLVEQVLIAGSSNGVGDPLLWAPHNVARVLDTESAPLFLDSLHLHRIPELLRDLIRYGHAERGLRAALTDEALAAVDRHADRYWASVHAWDDEDAD